MSVITSKSGKLEYLTAQGIPVPHCFTTRLGGVSTGELASMNLAVKLDETRENVAENYRILGRVLGFSPEDLVLTRQTHSTIVRAVDRSDCRGCFHRDYPECDALITNTPGLVLTVFTADCTPILFCDPVTGAVGAAHAGWRGTAGDIAGKTVAAMEAQFGCKAENIRCAIGPNIAQCCFETHRDVPDAMIAALGEEAKEYILPKGEKYYVNLKAINAALLRRAGVRHIEISDACTACDTQRFWSHRKVADRRGSQGALILCKEVGK